MRYLLRSRRFVRKNGALLQVANLCNEFRENAVVTRLNIRMYVGVIDNVPCGITKYPHFFQSQSHYLQNNVYHNIKYKVDYLVGRMKLKLRLKHWLLKLCRENCSFIKKFIILYYYRQIDQVHIYYNNLLSVDFKIMSPFGSRF